MLIWCLIFFSNNSFLNCISPNSFALRQMMILLVFPFFPLKWFRSIRKESTHKVIERSYFSLQNVADFTGCYSLVLLDLLVFSSLLFSFCFFFTFYSFSIIQYFLLLFNRYGIQLIVCVYMKRNEPQIMRRNKFVSDECKAFFFCFFVFSLNSYLIRFVFFVRT